MKPFISCSGYRRKCHCCGREIRAN